LKRPSDIDVPAVGLRGRLAFSIALIMLAALGLTYVAVYRGTGSDLRDQIDRDLTGKVESLARSLVAGPTLDTAGYTVRARNLVLTQPFGPDSQLIAISVEGGGTATNQPELFGLPGEPGTPGDDEGGPPDSPGEDSADDEHEHDEGHSDDADSARALLESEPGFSTAEIEGAGEVRLLSQAARLPDGGAAIVRVGQPLVSVDRALDGLSRTFLVVGLFALIAAIAAGWLLASRTARPIRKLAEVAEGVDGGELSARMPIEATRNDEVRRLAESFNLMLDRLEAAFTGQRAFVADASHDLRTPLTIVKGQLEVLARNPDPDPQEVSRVATQVSAATDRMERLVDDLLLLARTDSGAGVQLEASELEPLLAAETESLGETSERSIELGDVTATPVTIDRERVARAVSNLVANAVAHTSEGGRVKVSAFDREDRVVIAVDDDGPGIPADLRERVFDRFARLDTSRSSDSGGSGLGLAIVKAVAELHGGEAACTDSPLGGARFTVSVPLS
jgi:two-component system OmpR family sensor kinase